MLILDLLHGARRYEVSVVGTIIACFGLILATNAVIDPLLYFKGDLVNGQTKILDERVSPITMHRSAWEEIDCLILGSSRLTFLDARAIRGYKCANLSVVGAGPRTILAYSEYAVEVLEVEPKLVVIGVDGFMRNDTIDAPDFIVNKKRVPFFFHYYATLDVAIFSLSRIFNPSRAQIVTDNHYRKHQPLNYRLQYGDQARRKLWLAHDSCEPHGIENTITYNEIIKNFPDARIIAFVPPVTPYPMTAAIRKNTMRGYLNTVHEFSKVFDEFYDFSVPSELTMELKQTYDGSHYTADVYDNVIDDILSGTMRHGIKLTGTTLNRYMEIFMERSESFLEFHQTNPTEPCDGTVGNN